MDAKQLKRRKEQWKVNATARLARVLADGGRHVSLLLDREGAEALAWLQEYRRLPAVQIVKQALIEVTVRLRAEQPGPSTKRTKGSGRKAGA